MVLSLNNHQLSKDSVVVARSVMRDEITSGYERLQVTETLSVLHGATGQFRFAVPSGFEVTSVSGLQVARWTVTAEHGQRVLEVRSQEPITDTTSFSVSAIRTPVALATWQLPKFVAIDVATLATLVGLLLDSRMKPADLQPSKLISIDTGILSQELPANNADRQAGAPTMVPVAAFYAPGSDYELKAKFAPPPADLRVTTNTLLTLTEAKLKLQGGFTISNASDPLLGFDFSAPASWQLTELKLDGGVALLPEVYPAEHGTARIHVRLPRATPAGQSCNIYFRAESSPEGWLDDWSAKRVEFPEFRVAGATRDGGAIAVESQDDMLARAELTTRLTPLDANEKAGFGLSDVATELAFRYDEPPYSLMLAVTRVQPRLTGTVLFAFFPASEPDPLHAALRVDPTTSNGGRASQAGIRVACEHARGIVDSRARSPRDHGVKAVWSRAISGNGRCCSANRAGASSGWRSIFSSHLASAEKSCLPNKPTKQSKPRRCRLS